MRSLSKLIPSFVVIYPEGIQCFNSWKIIIPEMMAPKQARNHEPGYMETPESKNSTHTSRAFSTRPPNVVNRRYLRYRFLFSRRHNHLNSDEFLSSLFMSGRQNPKSLAFGNSILADRQDVGVVPVKQDADLTATLPSCPPSSSPPPRFTSPPVAWISLCSVPASRFPRLPRYLPPPSHAPFYNRGRQQYPTVHISTRIQAI